MLLFIPQATSSSFVAWLVVRALVSILASVPSVFVLRASKESPRRAETVW